VSPDLPGSLDFFVVISSTITIDNSDKIVDAASAPEDCDRGDKVMKITVIVAKLSKFTAWLLSLMRRQLAIGFLAIAMSLSGCVKYDTGVHFSSLGDGEIIEHIYLSEQLNSFSQTAVQTWLNSIEQRTIAEQGRLERLNDREFRVIIPFDNPQQLVTKVNRYFNSDLNSESKSQFKAVMRIDRSNFLVVIRNHLVYDLDLRSIAAKSLSGTVTTTPKVSIDANNPIDLDFSVQSPWGIKNISGNGANVSSDNENRQMTWQLKSGQIDRIDAVFWLPNPLGIGAVTIGLISIAGYYLKYRQLPWQLASK